LFILLGFCDRLDSLVVAESCYQSREYHRALMYLEQHIASTNKGLSELTEGGLLAVRNILYFGIVYFFTFNKILFVIENLCATR